MVLQALELAGETLGRDLLFPDQVRVREPQVVVRESKVVLGESKVVLGQSKVVFGQSQPLLCRESRVSAPADLRRAEGRLEEEEKAAFHEAQEGCQPQSDGCCY